MSKTDYEFIIFLRIYYGGRKMVEGGPPHKRWWKEVLLIKDGGRRSPSFQAPKELCFLGS